MMVLVFIALLSFLKGAVLLQFESYRVMATLKKQSKTIVGGGGNLYEIFTIVPRSQVSSRVLFKAA